MINQLIIKRKTVPRPNQKIMEISSKLRDPQKAKYFNSNHNNPGSQSLAQISQKYLKSK